MMTHDKDRMPRGYCPQCRCTSVGGAVKCLYCGASIPNPTRSPLERHKLLAVRLISLATIMGLASLLWIFFRPATPKELADQFYSAISRNNVKETERLLERGADPNFDLGGASTMLLLAGRNRQIMEVLLKHGADPNKASEWGLTPLVSAITASDFKSAHLLMAAGADANLYNRRWGNSPLTMALAVKAPQDFIVALIDKGVDVNIANPGGVTPLLSAVEMGDAYLVKRLLGHGANPCISGSFLVDRKTSKFARFSPLQMARRRQRRDIEQMLLKALKKKPC